VPPRATETQTQQDPLQQRDDDVRAGAHSDYGSITLLFRLPGQAGLEVLAPSGDGTSSSSRWAPVPVVPPGTEDDAGPPILVNIGDLLSYWTNGLLRSTVHRVAFTPDDSKNTTATATAGGGSSSSSSAGVVPGESSTDPRYSIAFFCHPATRTQLTAVPSERVRQFRGSLGDASEGNPYAERKVLTADEHLKMRLQASYLQMYEKKEEVAA
jgi:isopenicillin N synthase-like dioxygenase